MDFSNLQYWLLFTGGIAAFLAVAGAFRLFRRETPGAAHKAFLVLIGLSALGYASISIASDAGEQFKGNPGLLKLLEQRLSCGIRWR